MWQHVKLSVQIRPWDTLACCWDVKQPTNKQTLFFSFLFFFHHPSIPVFLSLTRPHPRFVFCFVFFSFFFSPSLYPCLLVPYPTPPPFCVLFCFLFFFFSPSLYPCLLVPYPTPPPFCVLFCFLFFFFHHPSAITSLAGGV